MLSGWPHRFTLIYTADLPHETYHISPDWAEKDEVIPSTGVVFYYYCPPITAASLYYIIIYYSDIHVSLIIMPCQEDTKLMFYCFLYDCSFCCLVLVDSASPSRFWLTRCKLSHIDPLLWKNVLTITVHLFGPRAAVLLMSIDKTIGCKLSGSPSLEGRW